MKLNEIRWIFLMVLSVTFPVMSQTEEEGDDLPQAEPYRQPMRPSFNRGNLGGVAQPSASYDISKTFDSMTRKSSADNRMGDDYNKGGNSRLDSGYSDSDSLTRDDYYDPYASESGYGGGGGYGGYASESGYGYSLTKYVDCNSAIAILSLILFLDILRDIVQSLTTTGGKRRKRDTSFMEQFILDGGADAMVEGIPDIVIPLLYELNEAVQIDEDHGDCLPGSMCRANWFLAERYGGMGRVIGALLSNVVAKAFVGGEPLRLHQALEASRWGRRGTACQIAYPCGTQSKNSTSGRY